VQTALRSLEELQAMIQAVLQPPVPAGDPLRRCEAEVILQKKRSPREFLALNLAFESEVV
jgi:hypothetical protein